MKELAQKMITFVNDARPMIIAIATIATLIVGIMVMWPEEAVHEKGKKFFKWIIIGAGIALSAVGIAAGLEANF